MQEMQGRDGPFPHRGAKEEVRQSINWMNLLPVLRTSEMESSQVIIKGIACTVETSVETANRIVDEPPTESYFSYAW
jgi:hypothetical protein